MNQLTVIIIAPGQHPYKTTITNTLAALQQTVGGYIQVLQLDEHTVLICDEEGKLKGYQPNRGLVIDDQLVDVIHGTFILIATDPNTHEYTSMSDEQATKLINQYWNPEEFDIFDGQLIAVPIVPDHR